MKLKMKGFMGVRKKLQVLRGRQLKTAEMRGMSKAVKYLELYIKTHFTRTKMLPKKGAMIHGNKRYRSPDNRRYPSEPGQPPAIQTTKLRASIKSEVTRDSKGNVIGVVGALRKGKSVEYDIFNEFGTGQRGAGDASSELKGSKAISFPIGGLLGGRGVKSLKFNTGLQGMQRRPFLTPAIQRNMAMVNKLIQSEVKKKTDVKL